MRYIFILIFTAIASLNASEIKIAVAANVSYAIDDLIKEFNKTHPHTDVKVTLGSSGKLTSQIVHGAPYELFMSADMRYPDRLYKDKKSSIKPAVYAKGSLALLSAKVLEFKKGMDILKDENIGRIAVANPKTAPYGKAAFEAFENAKVLDSIKQKLIYGESVSQTVSYTLTAADMGVVAKSSLYSSKMSRFKEGVNWIELDPKLYTPIEQGIVIIKESRETKAFYDFILSKEAQNIFKKYGYQLP